MGLEGICCQGKGAHASSRRTPPYNSHRTSKTKARSLHYLLLSPVPVSRLSRAKVALPHRTTTTDDAQRIPLSLGEFDQFDRPSLGWIDEVIVKTFEAIDAIGARSNVDCWM